MATKQTMHFAGIDIEWDDDGCLERWAGGRALALWIEGSISGLMLGMQRMVGTERFNLSLQHGGRQSVDGGDWLYMQTFPTFEEGFEALSVAARVAGWGLWRIVSVDREKKEARFSVRKSWEAIYQKDLGVCWGSSMQAGKFAGIGSKLFGVNCWAEQTMFAAKGDPYDEFIVKPSDQSIEVELENLLATDHATRADLAVAAVALEKLRKEVEERKQIEEQLLAAKEAADRANRAKSEFLASMSHELRTPLNGILGYAQILEKAEDLSPVNRAGVQVIKKSGEHLLKLIEDVLDLAKIEAGRMELVLGDVHFPSFVRTVVELCAVRAEQKGLTFSHESSGPMLSGVRSDEKRLTQVLLNLLGNAIKFTREGGICFRVQVTDDAHDSERTVRFDIEDTGPGIAPEHLVRIFEPFEQVGDASMRAEGTGLGLAISKRIVDRMGGTLTVRSELGRGSVFTVTLRLRELVEPLVAQGLTHWANIRGYQGPRRVVLVVDDNAENRAVVRDLLTPVGFMIVEAESGDAALLALAHGRPDLVLMDLAMPGMDGYETTRRLRQIPELGDLIVIASSASVSQQQQGQSLRAGCDDFLRKPIEANALFQKLRRHLHLTWIHKSDEASAPSSAPQAADAPLRRPPIDVLSTLLDAANDGRLQDLTEQLNALEQQDAQLRPWARKLRAMAESFELKNVRASLQADMDAAARA